MLSEGRAHMSSFRSWDWMMCFPQAVKYRKVIVPLEYFSEKFYVILTHPLFVRRCILMSESKYFFINFICAKNKNIFLYTQTISYSLNSKYYNSFSVKSFWYWFWWFKRIALTQKPSKVKYRILLQLPIETICFDATKFQSSLCAESLRGEK